MDGLTVRNARLTEHGHIDAEYSLDGENWTHYTAAADDVVELSRAVYAQAILGPVAPYVTPPIEERRAMMPAISKRQLRIVLIRHSITPQNVRDIIEAMPAGMAREEALVEWEDAAQFERLHPTLLAVAGALLLSPEAVDAMWAEAQLI